MAELLPGPVETTPMPHAVGPVMMAVPGPPGAGGGASPELIAQAVDAYLTANPPAAPVQSVAGRTGAVTLSLDDAADTATRLALTPAERAKLDDIPTRGLIITDANVGTIPAGSVAGELIGFRNVSATAKVVAGFAVAAGDGVILEWTGTEWAKTADLAALTLTVPLTPVTATAPTADDATDTFTIPTCTGVVYSVDGAVKAAGVYSVGDVTGTVTVVASAAAGYTLSGASSWPFTFTKKIPLPVRLPVRLSADANVAESGDATSWVYASSSAVPSGTLIQRSRWGLSPSASGYIEATIVTRGAMNIGLVPLTSNLSAISSSTYHGMVQITDDGTRVNSNGAAYNGTKLATGAHAGSVLRIAYNAGDYTVTLDGAVVYTATALSATPLGVILKTWGTGNYAASQAKVSIVQSGMTPWGGTVTKPKLGMTGALTNVTETGNATNGYTYQIAGTMGGSLYANYETGNGHVVQFDVTAATEGGVRFSATANSIPTVPWKSGTNWDKLTTDAALAISASQCNANTKPVGPTATGITLAAGTKIAFLRSTQAPTGTVLLWNGTDWVMVCDWPYNKSVGVDNEAGGKLTLTALESVW